MSAETVNDGIVVADSTIRRAIVACVGVSSRTCTSPFPRLAGSGAGAGAVVPDSAAARSTSSRVIRPAGPVPTIPWSETPSSTAVRLATASRSRRSALPQRPVAAPSPLASVAIGSPIDAVAPSGTRIEPSVPSASAS